MGFALDNDRIYLRHNERLTAYDRHSLNNLWSVKMPYSGGTIPNLVLSETYLFTSVEDPGDLNTLYVLDSKSGKTLFQQPLRDIVWTLWPSFNLNSVIVNHMRCCENEGDSGDVYIDEFRVKP